MNLGLVGPVVDIARRLSRTVARCSGMAGASCDDHCGLRAVHARVVALEETFGHWPLDELVTEDEERYALIDVAIDERVVVEAGSGQPCRHGRAAHPRRHHTNAHLADAVLRLEEAAAALQR